LRAAIKLTAALTTIGWEAPFFVALRRSATNQNSITQGATRMSTYTLPDLLNQWQRGDMTAEQAAPQGRPHLLQHLVALVQRQTETEKPGALWARQLEQPGFQPKP